MPSPDVRAAVPESLNRDLKWVIDWCNFWGMKLNVIKTETIIVSRSCTMHHQSRSLTIDGTVMNESVNLDVVAFTVLAT